ncbi:uncharacterized protein JCM6883_003238 [Sporobolomyces salmoneus]|uniref:uncharacterized protein n=1 Tax=Sporobolomyces salmoneus TaxID=183962 RepID=UPI0031711D1D
MNTNPPFPLASTSTAPANDGPDLWSTILDSVKGTRGGINTKQCIILGAPRSGKTTLVRRIATTTGEPREEEEENERLDLGMSYSLLEVKDETSGTQGQGQEDILARLSIYQLPSPSPPFPSLLPLALSRETLLDSLIVVVLDWDKPWSFIEQLEGWIEMIKRQIDALFTDEEDREDLRTRARERVENYLRNYREPAAATASTTTSTTASSSSTAASAIDADSPLPLGTLIENLGIPIIVVCTKADQINTLEREREFTEEQFDYIQQTLRTICLRYGASLFYTSQTIPTSFVKLRQYILHRLFSSSSSSSSSTTAATTSNQPTSITTNKTTTRGFDQFPYRANVIDRDQTLVPTGWDSWGKIKILRESFNPEKIGNGWENDLSTLGQNQTKESQENELRGGDGGLKKEYEMMIVDFDSDLRPNNSSSNTSTATRPEPEQSFLQLHYQSLQSDLEKDPRLAFRNQQSTASSSSGSSSTAGRTTTSSGGVGPMSGNISDLPNVQNVLERASGGTGSSSTSRDSRTGLSSSRPASSASKDLPTRSSLSSSSSSALPPTSSKPSLPPTSPAAGAGAGGVGAAAGGNQVLADFFQSLLTARGSSGAAATGGSGSVTPGATTAGGGAGAVRRGSNTEVNPNGVEEK